MIPEILTPDKFEEAQRLFLESQIQQYPPRSWWPSSLGHQCDRYLVWSRTRWQEGLRHDYTLESIFGEGRLHAPSMYDRLEKMGYEVFREWYKPLEYKVGGGVISGKPDGALKSYKGVKFDSVGILELKTAQGHAFNKLDTLDDIKGAREPWVRGYYVQSNLYAFLANESWFVLAIKSKATGMMKVIPGELNFDDAETTLKRVEKLQPMVDRNEDPPPILYDESVCGRCQFRMICWPPREMGVGVQILEDSILADDIERRAGLRESKSEYDALDKSIKKRLKAQGVGDAICGNFLISMKQRPVKGFSVEARVDTIYDFQPLTTDDIEKIERGEQG